MATGEITTKRQSSLSIKAKRAPWWERNMGWVLVSPVLVMFVVFAFIPSITVILYAFSRVKLIRGNVRRTYIGLDNFRRAFDDPLIAQSVKITIKWMLGVTFAEVMLGLLLALLLTQNIPFRPVVTSLLIIPIIMPPVSVAVAWLFMYDINFGIYNYFLGLLSVEPVGWLTNRDIALYSIMIVDIWQATPFVFLLLYAGLISLPKDPYEAAAIDGANTFRIFRTVTLPLLRPVFLVVILLRLIDAARIFDKIFVMTQGGPGSSTYSLTYTIYIRAFTSFDLGYSAALSFLFQFGLIIIATFYVRRVLFDYAAPTS
jgi:multiple sugar transport system permease protein